MYDTCHGQMIAVVGARQQGAKEVLPGGQLELIERLLGRINHIHLIDSDNTCHKDAKGNDETSRRSATASSISMRSCPVSPRRSCHTTGGRSICASIRTPGR
jgi:hypothetical protein